MSDDRKYKQRGYQNDDGRSRSRGPMGTGEPRSRIVTSFKETSRCDSCGVDLPPLFEVKTGSLCSKCGSPLHTCRNCHSFDTSAPKECAQPVETRIAAKDKGNDCTLFQVRTISVKDVTVRSGVRPEEAKKALEDLFKK